MQKAMEFLDFFRAAYGKSNETDFGPYDYQERLANIPWPSLVKRCFLPCLSLSLLWDRTNPIVMMSGMAGSA